MTRAQLQGERDAWYQNGLNNGFIRMFDWLKVETAEAWADYETAYVGDR